MFGWVFFLLLRLPLSMLANDDEFWFAIPEKRDFFLSSACISHESNGRGEINRTFFGSAYNANDLGSAKCGTKLSKKARQEKKVAPISVSYNPNRQNISNSHPQCTPKLHFVQLGEVRIHSISSFLLHIASRWCVRNRISLIKRDPYVSTSLDLPRNGSGFSALRIYPPPPSLSSSPHSHCFLPISVARILKCDRRWAFPSFLPLLHRREEVINDSYPEPRSECVFFPFGRFVPHPLCVWYTRFRTCTHHIVWTGH